LLLSRGEEESGGHNNPGLLANCFEALIGAIFVDQGVKKAEKFALKLLTPKLEEIIMATLEKDPADRIATAKQLKQSLETVI